jgi:ABC-type spermidine/putrescine transport system permease subunit I
MILPLLNAMRRMDMTLIRAAEILGANPLRVFFHVYLPLSMPGVTAGVLLVFISAVGFYVTPAVLGGPRQMMIAVLIEQYVTRTLNWPLASALATILLVITTVLYLVYERATRRLGGALSMGQG